MVGDELDRLTMTRIKMATDSGGVVNRAIAQCVGQAVISVKAPAILAVNGGSIILTEAWARLLLNSMGFSKRESQLPDGFVNENKFTFLNQIAKVMKDGGIPPDMILNSDQPWST